MSRSHYNTTQLLSSGPHDASKALHQELGRELDAVSRLFGQWSADAASKRQQALATRGYNNATFDLALLVFNKRGECRKGARKAQDWYFSARHNTTTSVAQACARCYVCVERQETYYIDRAKDWQKADELCRHCMHCVMRQLLGQDDAAIMEEARHIMASDWSPIINPRLADALVDSRTFFSML